MMALVGSSKSVLSTEVGSDYVDSVKMSLALPPVHEINMNTISSIIS